jgi:hypothetical protein
VRVLQSFVAHLSEHSLKLTDIRAIKLVVLGKKKVSELASGLSSESLAISRTRLAARDE